MVNIYNFKRLLVLIKMKFHLISFVKNKNSIGLDFIIDKLTNSIENVFTGDSFATDISILNKNDIKNIT